MFENRAAVTATKCMTKSSLFILLFGVIRLPEVRPVSGQKLRLYSLTRHIADARLAEVPGCLLSRLVDSD